ncbi:hypothetical protein FIA58_004745 [Flavobacterium jejuense]|uniref:Putative beta-lactamase-inhibitor-like PepSY-like domain-containing protein n=1 Tax=Flavobacterium jejuense TaxID=1544455 RepID=A0ABX0IMG0_9FLAO|nr:PepSY-like domain-containing protein [Flavobacterium jejuense]NHN24980.1 hypothetical protein [Flavobacterium jejuense]
MKKLSFTVIIAISSMALSQAQEKKVPDAVIKAFKKEHPNVKASWDIEKKGFEAEFKMNGKDASENYSSNGKKMATEIEIEEKELPKKALEYVLKNYPNKKIKETAKITDANGTITYEIELKIDTKNTDLLFDSNGEFIKK